MRELCPTLQKIAVVALSFLFFTVTHCLAATVVTLAWDTNTPTPQGYRVFKRKMGEAYDYTDRVYDGTRTTCIINVEEESEYFFVVRAYDGDDESVDSNEVHFVPHANGSEYASVQPDLSGPESTTGVKLTPSLAANTTSGVNGELHHKTHWQVSFNPEFSDLVFELESATNLEDLTIPELILDAETTYYWRARHGYGNGSKSAWADPLSFTTVSAQDSRDTDSDGIVDNQSVSDMSLDLNANGKPDVLENEVLIIRTETGHEPIAIESITDNANIVSFKSISEDSVYDTDNKPSLMTSGILSFKIYLRNGASAARVRIHLNKAAPQNANWYKFDVEQGWYIYEGAEFSADRSSVTLTFQDGGAGDDDGVANGIIVDPSALALGSADTTSHHTTSNSGVQIGAATDSCFISTVSIFPADFNDSHSMLIAVLMIILLAGLNAFARKRNRETKS
ncbi:MAG: fibronectin type III domain-containing protein [Desulfobacteraceae bacterium]|nr:fibronectin type III domain-containing protein [Desulfobacteraceae bacterium]